MLASFILAYWPHPVFGDNGICPNHHPTDNLTKREKSLSSCIAESGNRRCTDSTENSAEINRETIAEQIRRKRQQIAEGHYDKPEEAMEFFRLKRLPEGEREIPAENYLAAYQQMERMRQYSFADGKLQPSRKQSAKNAAVLSAWTQLGPGNIGGRTRANRLQADFIADFSGAGIAACATVSAASFKGNALAAQHIVAAFGADLALTDSIATTLPLPKTFDGTRVVITDSAGVARESEIFFVSPRQINYLFCLKDWPKAWRWSRSRIATAKFQSG